ncbi:hypothetical protein K7X08_001218 [Anisodus acutangulus]|uniref:Glycosyltransferase N-terminal domain-containing protein n=1 Tax=Anisodus acutangulus TaxID=402998 RepID=A0A9Q1RNX6_9SOLA|nr:hypothetical protein K7X08_001218 [Anisodus acutangulus]
MVLREPIASFFRDISSKARRVAVVHDSLMAYNVQDDMYYSYICTTAALTIQFDAEEPKRLPSLEGCYPDEIKHLGSFQERVKGVGLLVREWAPQPETLAHSSTCGFMSHCRWNSCLESITMGVPIAAWPIRFDQPKNGFLMKETMKVGLIVREWEKREELVSASSIENVVRKLMASEEGDVNRKRIEELGEAVRRPQRKGELVEWSWILSLRLRHITR